MQKKVLLMFQILSCIFIYWVTSFFSVEDLPEATIKIFLVWRPSWSYDRNIRSLKTFLKLRSKYSLFEDLPEATIEIFIFFAFEAGEIVHQPHWGPSWSYDRNIHSFFAFEAGGGGIVHQPRWGPSRSYNRNICSFLAFEAGEIVVHRPCWGPSWSYDRNIRCLKTFLKLRLKYL